MTPRQRWILRSLQIAPACSTTRDLMWLWGRPLHPDMMRRDIAELEARGLVERLGKRDRDSAGRREIIRAITPEGRRRAPWPNLAESGRKETTA